jgi:hypothetical protein
MPRWCVIYRHASLCLLAIGVFFLHQWQHRGNLRCYIYEHIGVGFGVARFDYEGQFSGASEREASDSAGLHAFFMPLPILILIRRLP